MGEIRGTHRFPAFLRRKNKFIHAWVFQVKQHQGIQHSFFILSVSGNPKLRQQNYIPIYCQASTSQIAPNVLLSERTFFRFEETRERKAAAKSDRSSNCLSFFFDFFFFFFKFCKKILEVQVLPRLTPAAAEGRLSRVASLPFHFCHSQRRAALSKSHFFLAAKPQPLLHSAAGRKTVRGGWKRETAERSLRSIFGDGEELTVTLPFKDLIVFLRETEPDSLMRIAFWFFFV